MGVGLMNGGPGTSMGNMVRGGATDSRGGLSYGVSRMSVFIGRWGIGSVRVGIGVTCAH